MESAWALLLCAEKLNPADTATGGGKALIKRGVEEAEFIAVSEVVLPEVIPNLLVAFSDKAVSI